MSRLMGKSPTRAHFSQSQSLSGLARSNGVEKQQSRHNRDSVAGKEHIKDMFPMSTERFQKRVLYVLNDIRSELEEIRREKNVNDDRHDLEFKPAETVEQLLQLENLTKDPKDRQLMIQILSKIGGINLKDGVRLILQRLISNEVMSLLNMKGKRGKRAFAGTGLCKVVIESATKRFGCTEMEVVAVIASALKYAPDRRGGGGRPKN